MRSPPQGTLARHENATSIYSCRAAGLTHSSVPSLIISARRRSKASDESCERSDSSWGPVIFCCCCLWFCCCQEESNGIWVVGASLISSTLRCSRFRERSPQTSCPPAVSRIPPARTRIFLKSSSVKPPRWYFKTRNVQSHALSCKPKFAIMA